mmetsp:Transcript_47688/g.111662  ORF Transcript_47688/g.111662 Transcript_47688/m.111662 type:complete len:549 (+) Transcript_47688:39-1685(+)
MSSVHGNSAAHADLQPTLLQLRDYLDVQFAKQEQLLAELKSDLKSLPLSQGSTTLGDGTLLGIRKCGLPSSAMWPRRSMRGLAPSLWSPWTSSKHPSLSPCRSPFGAGWARRRVLDPAAVDPGLIRQHIEAHETRNNRLVRAMSSLQSADLRTRARDAVQSGVFNALILFLIVVNAVLLGVEIQVSSSIGEDDIPSWFMVVNTGIVGIFVIEIILKLVALGCHEFWRGPQAGWNMFDVIIVAFSALEVVIDLFAQTLAASMWGADAWSFMRTLRLARALRGLRFFRMIRYFSALRALILSIVSTMSSLLWTLVLLFLLFYSFSVIIMQMVSDYCRYLAVIRSSDKNAVPECPESLRLYWPGVAEQRRGKGPILCSVSVLAVAVLIFYIIISFFTILNVVTGVFVNTAIERASYDRDIASLKALQRRTEQMKELQEAFEDIDEGQTNEVRMQDIERATSLDRLGACMQALDISAEDVKTLFTLIDTDNSGAVDLEEFVSGCMQLHGPAKSLQIAKMSYDNKRIKEAIQHITYQVLEVNRKLTSALRVSR